MNVKIDWDFFRYQELSQRYERPRKIARDLEFEGQKSTVNIKVFVISLL